MKPLRLLLLMLLLSGFGNNASAAWSYFCQQDADGDNVGFGRTMFYGTLSTCPNGYTNIGFCFYGGPMNNPCVPPPNESDNCPTVSNANQADANADGVGDVCQDRDSDSDGITDASDNCPTVQNNNQLNTDGDTQGNACDLDDDNDGVPDTADKFPLDSTESVDTDNDGLGNNTDTDDDNDGVPDVVDSAPLDPAITSEIVLPLNNHYQGSLINDSAIKH
jgi:hypothetical protein